MKTSGLMAAATLGTAILTGCDPGADQETGSVTRESVREARGAMDPAIAAALDSGNAAYRAGDYDEALRRYREAVRGDEELAAAWFGVSMAEAARGNIAAADSAMQRARELAPRATLIRPEVP